MLDLTVCGLHLPAEPRAAKALARAELPAVALPGVGVLSLLAGRAMREIRNAWSTQCRSLRVRKRRSLIRSHIVALYQGSLFASSHRSCGRQAMESNSRSC